MKISQELICLRCNSSLSVKNGKYGSFYGCKSFPRCRYTQKISA
ncbi:topoisomerase DNA-binding C4 zinc finger domain-containing protein [Sporosarcina jiandibaonis]